MAIAGQKLIDYMSNGMSFVEVLKLADKIAVDYGVEEPFRQAIDHFTLSVTLGDPVTKYRYTKLDLYLPVNADADCFYQDIREFSEPQ